MKEKVLMYTIPYCIDKTLNQETWLYKYVDTGVAKPRVEEAHMGGNVSMKLNSDDAFSPHSER